MRQPLPDRLLSALDRALKTLTTSPEGGRASPAANLPEPALSAAERTHSAALLRVNHAGEIAALYEGQKVFARSPAVAQQLERAAAEEQDHLAWCADRLAELDGRPSALSPLWYAGGYGLGVLAGAVSDRASLGFVEETERQVVAHLQDHLGRLPAADDKSAAILEHMADDEAHHGQQAAAAGAVKLPPPARALMRLGGSVLRRVAYWV
jgi:ubiquinone biosynthesis monooxygenase Coq7